MVNPSEWHPEAYNGLLGTSRVKWNTVAVKCFITFKVHEQNLLHYNFLSSQNSVSSDLQKKHAQRHAQARGVG